MRFSPLDCEERNGVPAGRASQSHQDNAYSSTKTTPDPWTPHYFGNDWPDWLDSEILYRDAEAVIGANDKISNDAGAPGRDKK